MIRNSIGIKLWFGIVLMLTLVGFYWSTAPERRVLFSDQAAHISAALSLWHDWDLEYTLTDLARFRKVMPAEPGPRGLFLKTGIEGRLYFAKPFLYALFASPFVAILGLNGFLFFNMLCIGVIGFIGIKSLTPHFGNFHTLILITGLLIFSPFLAWAPIAHPDIFIATLFVFGGYLLLGLDSTAMLRLAGAVFMGLVVYEKPTFVVIFALMLLALIGLVSVRQLFYIVVTTSIAWAIPTSVNYFQDGNFFAYQGLRFYVTGVVGTFPLEAGWEGIPTQSITDTVFGNSTLMTDVFSDFRFMTDILSNWSLVPTKYFDFLLGRQTGMVLYFPVALAMLVLVVSRAGWRSILLVAGFFVYLTLNWTAFPINGYGGAGSYGPRYTMQALPALLLAFMLTKQRGPVGNFADWRKTRFLIMGAFCLAVFFQYRVLLDGEDSVKKPDKFLMSGIANIFPLETSLLPVISLIMPKTFSIKSGNNFIYKKDGRRKDGFNINVGEGFGSEIVFFQIGEPKEFPVVEVSATHPVQIDFVADGQSLQKADVFPYATGKIKFCGLFTKSFKDRFYGEVRWRCLNVRAHLLSTDKTDGPTLVSLNFLEGNQEDRFYTLGGDLTPKNFEENGVKPLFCWEPDPTSFWSSGSWAGFQIPLKEEIDGSLQLNALLTPFIPDKIKNQTVGLYVNGTEIDQFEFDSGSSASIRSSIPKEVLTNDNTIRLLFHIHQPTIPEHLHDDRFLGIAVNKISFQRLELSPINQKWQVFGFGAGNPATPWLVNGWSYPEDWGVWSNSKHSTLFLPIQNEGSPIELRFGIVAFTPPQAPNLEVDVFVNKKIKSTWRLEHGRPLGDHVIQIESDEMQGDDGINIDFQIRNPRSPYDLGLSEDRRRIGIGLRDLEITPLHQSSGR